MKGPESIKPSVCLFVFALAIYHCSPFPFLCFILKNAWGATLIDFFRKTQIRSSVIWSQFGAIAGKCPCKDGCRSQRWGRYMGGTYMPVNGSYRTLTQCSSNVQIGWDWDGIYYEYWYWIFFFLSGLLIVHYFGFEGGTHSQWGFLAKSLLPNDNRLLDF